MSVPCKSTTCLVESSPKADAGPDTATIKEWIQQGLALGVERFYFTGGEPFYRPDIIDLIRTIITEHEKELIIITNGLLLDKLVGAIHESPADWQRLKLQISLDGTSAAVNDKIRGKGCFEGVMAGLKSLHDLPVETVLTSVAHPDNIKELVELPKLARELGVGGIHLMWPHLRGRFKGNGDRDRAIHESPLPDMVQQIMANARRYEVVFDNYESIKARVNGRPGIKFDLSGAGWESVCIYCDGAIYPSAAFANHGPLHCGGMDTGLKDVWRNSQVLQQLRATSLIQNETWGNDPFRFLIGGGDVEHAYFYSENGEAGSFVADDPYYPIYRQMTEEALFELADAKREQAKSKGAFADAPQIYHAMGEGAIACDSKGSAESYDQEVVTLHSNCVLGFDVDKPRLLVQEFYGAAAEQPQEGLCCPTTFDPEDIAHIPQDVIERFYGCGSPVSSAAPDPGETYMDLGSGAGIDCFIAAKHVGSKGKVIGVDMTERMLSVAAENQPKVAQALGYDVVEFREGFLEKIPVEDASIDIVTSNCVINLSPDKKAVSAEIWRCLNNGGRTVIADIISDRDVPPNMKINPILWGECLSGALTQEEFLSYLEDCGFYGVQILKKSFWKEVGGCKFYSVTVRAFKFAKQAGCDFQGQKVVYLGPFKGVTDEDGPYFPRNQAVEVCTDTYAKLSVGALKDKFIFVNESNDETVAESCCEPDTSCC